MFRKKKPEIESRKYLYICYPCRDWLEVDQKIDHCPKCKEPIEEPFEHINRIYKLGWAYYHGCEDCKIQFDTTDEDVGVACPRCQKPSKNYGHCISCGPGLPTTFLGKLVYKMLCFLPW